VTPHLHGAVELVAVDAVGEELDHLVAAHLAVDHRVEPGALVFVGDQSTGVVVGLFEVRHIELRVGVVDELVGPVEPLRLRVRADDGRQEERVVRVVVRAELFAVGRRVSDHYSSTSAAAASVFSFARYLLAGR